MTDRQTDRQTDGQRERPNRAEEGPRSEEALVAYIILGALLRGASDDTAGLVCQDWSDKAGNLPVDALLLHPKLSQAPITGLAGNPPD